MTIEIRQHAPGSALSEFIEASHIVYRSDPAWVPPLHRDLRARLSPAHNPFFERGEAIYFTARRDGRLVGRCSAQIDREHLRVHADGSGFFGFFDTVDDGAVATALLDAAAAWLAARGMERMMGPFSLHVNDEVGLLIDGFEHPPVMRMAHSRPYQAALCDAAGLVKEKDLLAFRYDDPQLPLRAQKAWEDVKRMPEVRLRSIDTGRLDDEMQAVMRIYNDAWAGKWAFVPVSPDEVLRIARDLRRIIDPDIAFIAEIAGEPAGMCIMLPNLNEAIADLRGKLLPTGFLKLLFRTKITHPISTRLLMLGIRSDIRRQRRYGGLSTAMYVETARRGLAKGYKWGELSWTCEDDAPVNVGIRRMGARVYKRYRVYQRLLAPRA